MPIFATVFMIVTLSSIGLPGTNGFVGEFLILIGAFESDLRWWTVVASSGVILSAVYMLWMFQRVMFGELSNPKNQVLKDLNAREIVIMVPLVILIFVMGVYPTPFIDKMNPAIEKLITQTKQKQMAHLVVPPAPAVFPASAEPHAPAAVPAAPGMPAGHPALPSGHPVAPGHPAGEPK
jgi:NADH-quinone oxidoreductase subunit M